MFVAYERSCWALEYATFHDFHVEPRKIQSPGNEGEHGNLSAPRDLEGLKSHPVWSVVSDGIDQQAQVLSVKKPERRITRTVSCGGGDGSGDCSGDGSEDAHQ